LGMCSSGAKCVVLFVVAMMFLYYHYLFTIINIQMLVIDFFIRFIDIWVK
jgi:hypothetical protein